MDIIAAYYQTSGEQMDISNSAFIKKSVPTWVESLVIQTKDNIGHLPAVVEASNF